MRTPCFIRDQRGASIVEFAVVAPVFFLLIIGILEFGLFMFHKIVIESITMQVGRESSLLKEKGTGACSTTTDPYAYIRCYVREKTAYLINGDLVEVNINTVAGGGTRVPDICLSTTPPSSTVATCVGVGGYEEVNGIPGYQPASGNRVGDAGELIEVRVSYPWQVLVPFLNNLIGTRREDGSSTGVVMITSSTVFRNEPAAN